MSMKRSMVVGMSVSLLAGFLLAPGAVRAGGNDAPLPGSGIHYPGGYDPNTVGDVSGKASGISLPEKGPVSFRVDTGHETYTVLASASWYWKDLKVDLKDGAEVRVRGSKSLGKDANLYIVAQKIDVPGTGRSYSMRDPAGMPMWGGTAGGPKGGMTGNARGGMMGGGAGGAGMGGGMGGGMRR